MRAATGRGHPRGAEAAIEPAVRAFAEAATVVPCHGTLDAGAARTTPSISRIRARTSS